jgi:hypothetical protein
MTEIKTSSDAPQLGREAQALLLRVARDAIAAALCGQPRASPPEIPAPLNEPAACFVSLHQGGDLRGCIGVVKALRPLIDAVAHCARAAAFEDPRFEPLTKEDLAGIEIEISVLGGMRPLEEGELPRPGLDGVVISQGGREGLLLPQVATENGWDARRLMEETCRKAGLPRDSWLRGARASVFQARVFSERDLI